MQPDDWDILEEEKENMNKLEIRWVCEELVEAAAQRLAAANHGTRGLARP